MKMGLRSLILKTRTSRKCNYLLSAKLCTNSAEIEHKNEENVKDWKTELHATMRIFPNFVNEEEENSILKEMEPYLKRLRYEGSHWDNVSKIYRMFIFFSFF